MATSKSLSYFQNSGSEPLRPLTIGDLIDKAAYEWPNRVAVASFHENLTVTFNDVKEKSNQLATGLLGLGLKRGDRLGLIANNSTHWYITALAAARIGVILVPIKTLFVEDELCYCLRKVSVKGVVMDESYYKVLLRIAPKLKNLSSGQHIENPKPDEISFLVVYTDTQLKGAYRFNDLFMKTPDIRNLNEAAKLVDPDDPCVIIFSSGTTGPIKPTVVTHFVLTNNSYFSGKRLGFNKKYHTVCHPGPLCHASGFAWNLLCSLSHFSTLVLPSSTFSVEATLKSITKFNCSIVFGSPTMLIDLCALVKEKMKSDNSFKGINFDLALTGGSPCPSSLLRNIKDILGAKQVTVVFGMTEAGPCLITNTENDTEEQRMATVGQPCDHIEIKVVDKDGKMVPFNKPGELWIRSYCTTFGYWKDEEQTKKLFTSSRWMKTGDIFTLQENGYAVATGRIKDLIIRGGLKVIPSEVENILCMHPEVLQAEVYGVSDERMGEEVAASIRIEPSSKISESTLIQYCNEKMALFKVPKYVEFVQNFPLTVIGKVKKSVLREMMEKKLQLTV